MAGRISKDLRKVIEGRNPTRVDVLITVDAAEGGPGPLEDALSDIGVGWNKVGIRNKTVYEATVPTQALDQLRETPGVDLIDHSPSFSPTGTAIGGLPPTGATTLSADAHGATLYDVTDALGVEDAWEEAGTRGEGATIGMVDAPIDPNHEAYRHAVAGTAGGAGAEAHGSWVAGALVAEETETVQGRVRGVAPDADLYAHGALSGGGASATEIIEGIDYCLRNDCDVINLSLGGPHSEVMHQIVQVTREGGALPVTSAGNSGPAGDTLSCPAHHDEALTVGSCSLGGSTSTFSSRGPGAAPAGQKPEVMAYGGDAALGDYNLRVTEAILGPGTGGSYTYLIGTSMAAPEVAGVAALRAAAQREN